ncbi:MAG: phosphohistidine phosphatase SixA [Phycisphaerae bacterium]|nr:phosphohistidine phosphatase SixA [Phycisphaerae bacterium]
MFVYLVRHAIAVARGAGTEFADANRPLTSEGIKKMRRCTAALQQVGVRLTEVWTSPYVRAVQTAEILLGGFGNAVPIRVVEHLAPAGEFDLLVEELSRQPMSAGIALVGHEPFLGEFATYLLTGLRSGRVRFKKGGVACFEITDLERPIRGDLRWMLTPRQMMRIA